MMVKNLNFGDTAREQVFKGITKLTQAVSSTLGASGKCVLLEDAAGKPIITKDGVTVADSVILLDPCVIPPVLINMIFQLVYTYSRSYLIREEVKTFFKNDFSMKN